MIGTNNSVRKFIVTVALQCKRGRPPNNNAYAESQQIIMLGTGEYVVDDIEIV